LVKVGQSGARELIRQPIRVGPGFFRPLTFHLVLYQIYPHFSLVSLYISHVQFSFNQVADYSGNWDSCQWDYCQWNSGRQDYGRQGRQGNLANRLGNLWSLWGTPRRTAVSSLWPLRLSALSPPRPSSSCLSQGLSQGPSQSLRGNRFYCQG
jgi:hypothetical protein